MPERSDISPRGLAIGAAIVLSGIAVSLVVAAFFAQPAEIGQPRGFRLQTAPPQDIAAFRREKRARLESTGPVDATHVHIPIERAMQILAGKRQK